MQEILEWLNPEKILYEGGIYLVAFIIFAETGLFVGFFLPGDSLLFITGLFVGLGKIKTGLFIVIPVLILMAILGNLTGYYFGRWAGKGLYKRKDSWLFKKKYLTMTENYYNRHGVKTIFLGRFLPIIRTFAPILAGVIKMDSKKFFLYTLIGAVAWITTFTLIGWFACEIPGVQENLKWIVIGLIAVTLIPVAMTYFKERKNAKLRKE
ncbi:MAG: DedA family protein [Flavobacteriales bacterium]